MSVSLKQFAAAAAVAAGLASSSQAAIFFSEYVEGSSNNKALEIYNSGPSSVDLSTVGVAIAFNGGATPGTPITLSGSLASGDVYVLANSSASASVTGVADQTSGSLTFNGDDFIQLVQDGSVVDSIGQLGFDPGSEYGTGLASTADNTLRRKSAITAGDTNTGDAFDPSAEFDGFATDTFDGLGSHSVVPEPAAGLGLLALGGLLLARRKR